MMGFLPENFLKILKREKIIRSLFSLFVFSIFIFLFGITFLLPSYFTLIFSLDDILRAFNTEEISLKRKDVEGLESKIAYANSLTDSYLNGESQRKSFLGILLPITNSVPDKVFLTSIELANGKGGETLFHIRGKADTRSGLILYSQKLRLFDEIKEVRSPVSNLLSETNIIFLLEVSINPKYYEPR